MNDRITLQDYEIRLARFVASGRQSNAEGRGLKGRNHQPKEAQLLNHFQGICGEIAAARFIGAYWPATVLSGSSFLSECDIPPNIEVKTGSKHSFNLLIRKHEDLSRIFILVTGEQPNLWIRGWGVGHDIVDAKYLMAKGNRDEAYFIPPTALSTDWLELKKTHLWK